jgi:abequosyltransferase
MAIRSAFKTKKMIGVNKPKLSICITTFNRAKYIGQTLDSILEQLTVEVELVIVDGNSADNTPEIMAAYSARYPEIRYVREDKNSGIDGDYDKAVGYATGEYCWLMTDDDLLKPGAINRVLSELDGIRDLVIVNAEIRNADLSERLEERQLEISTDKSYSKNESDVFFAECLNYLSFIGGVVIRREFWLERNRKLYYGSLFIHVGVIFQLPRIENVYAISDPLIVVRYGNAMWTSRGFEIWSFKWPEFVWSFSGISDEAKFKVIDPERGTRIKTLFYSRGTGAYTRDEYDKFVRLKTKGIKRVIAHFISIIPTEIANIVSVFYFVKVNKTARMMLYDLLNSPHSTSFGKWIARAR